MRCVLRTMILSRVLFTVIVSAAAATAASAVNAPSACTQLGPSDPVQALILLENQRINSGGVCDAPSTFSRRIRSKRENALAPAIVRNPFLPANAITSTRPEGGHP